ncbi:unnamed protein product, partial [Allacma fusca]
LEKTSSNSSTKIVFKVKMKVLSLYLLLATVLAGSTGKLQDGKTRNVRHIGYGAHNQNFPGSPGYSANAPVPQPRGYATLPVPHNGGSPNQNYYNGM